MGKEEEINEILNKYKKKLNEQLGADVDESITSFKEDDEVSSIEYEKFREESRPIQFSRYEKLCRLSEKILKIKATKEEAVQLQDSIDTCHMQITPTGSTSFALLFPLIFIFIGLILSTIIPIIFTGEISSFFLIFFILTGVIIMFPLRKYPIFLANSWRMKASNEMVLCIFYVVTFMRHTSNLELALKFASNHLTGPLALDLKKVIWDVETQKYSNIKESLDHYLEGWRKWNMEFIEAFHLVESSLFETSESRRLDLLDKSLDVILEETYEKMLHYAQNLKSPITMLHMLGIILPILGLVILPLMVAFMGGVKWYYIAVIYNVLLPIGVFYLGKTILAQRPTGYGDTDISDAIPAFKKFKFINVKIGKSEIQIEPLYLCLILGLVLFMIGLLPLILHFIGFPDFNVYKDMPLLDYRMNEGGTEEVGPFSLVSAILSLLIPIALAAAIGLYYKFKTKELIKIRENSKKLEQEFASGLFQLGNRLGDGLPAEIAFGKVAEVMTGTPSGAFFEIVSTNIKKLGMSVKDAIFNSKNGALVYYPSNMIESSMKVLVQSAKKGPKIAAQALVNVSRYIKEMHRVNERLKDLLSDVISSMKSQITVMTPAIAGIVIGITSMITNIIGKLGPLLQQQQAGMEDIPMPTDLFAAGIPTYHFQIIVGVYVVQIIYILTILVNGIENGSDDLNEKYLIGQNLLRSTIIYSAIAMIVMVVFNIVASAVLSGVLK